MRIQIITLFPEMFTGVLGSSMLWKAADRGIATYEFINLRNFGIGSRQQVDDTPYGGGDGMLLKPEPLVACLEYVLGLAPDIERVKTRVIVTSAKGAFYTQRSAERLVSEYERVILACGRYEGIDERFIQRYVDQEWSIGDYVLSGGELPAMVMIDAISRRVDGVLGDNQSAQQDSFVSGLLDCPHYTRPEMYDGDVVPEVLLSGNHAKIQHWRWQQSLKRTLARRPDLLASASLNATQRRLLAQLQQEQTNDNLGQSSF